MSLPSTIHPLRRQPYSAVGLLTLWLLAAVAGAESPVPIYESEPFDQIVLTAKYENQAFRVYPVEITARPDEASDGDLLRVRLLDIPDRYYDVAWRDIERLEKFPAIVLAKARALIQQRDFDSAYWHLEFLRREYPQTAGVDETIAELILQDAANAFRVGAYAEALSLLDEAYSRDPSRAAAVTAAETVARKMFSQYVTKGDFLAARDMLDWAEVRFGRDRIGATLEAWQEQLRNLANQQLTAARSAVAENNWRAAYDATQQTLRIWPDLPGVDDLARQVAGRYPVVRVGVTRPAVSFDPRRSEDWAARRAGRLRFRTLVELQGFGPEGGEYFSPLGKLAVNDDARGLSLQVRPSSTGSLANLLTAYDVANLLLEMARPDGPRRVPLWSQLVQSISLPGVFAVEVRLRQPVLRPEALLQTPLGELRDDSPAGPTNPYVIRDRDDRQLRLVLNELYAERTAGQPVEIVEAYFDDPAVMLEQFRGGELDLIDRLFPADVENLRRDAGIRIQPYAVPSVHFLVPNFEQPLMQQRTFRRALVYGISRETILRQDLLGNSRLEGCQVLSGPAPAGLSLDDPLGYAYDPRIPPRAYEPALAFTLAEVARSQLQGWAEKRGEPPPAASPLRLLYPAAAVPRIGATAIAQYLNAIGIACTPVEMRAGETTPTSDQWDLLYVDMVMTEPMFDLRRLLGAQGLIAGGSSYLELALRQLSLAVTWEQAREALRNIHRLAHEEVAVIPLWQLSEHFALQPQIQNVRDLPLSLYQNVEQWRLLPASSLAGP